MKTDWGKVLVDAEQFFKNLVKAIEDRERYIRAAEAVFESVEMDWNFEQSNGPWSELREARRVLKLPDNE